MVLLHALEDIGIGNALRDLEHRNGIGIAALSVEGKSSRQQGRTHGGRDAGMAIEDVLIAHHVFQRLSKTVDVAGRHGIGEPLALKIVLH